MELGIESIGTIDRDRESYSDRAERDCVIFDFGRYYQLR